jgi:hypothetical protein
VFGRNRGPTTLRELRKALTEDSIERKKLVDKLVQAVREDERQKVLTTMGAARARAEAERG